MATAAEIYQEASQQWEEAVELDLYRSEDIVYGIMPLLVRGLDLDPDHVPSLDLLSDMLMEIGGYDEAIEYAEKLRALAPDGAGYQEKLSALTDFENDQRRAVRVYLHQKRQRLLKNHACR